MGDSCIFCKIVKGEIPSKKVYEDDDFLAFHDINPIAPIHILIIPRHHIVSLQDVTSSDSEWLGRMMALVPQIALESGCLPGTDGGFRVVVNSGAHGGQEVGHLHLHILGGPRPWTARAALTA